jgi:urea transport system permease protein
VQDLVVTALNALTLISVLALVGLGLTISFGLMNVTNLAHGDFVAIGAFSVYFAQKLGGSFWVGLIAAPLAAGTVGWLLEALILRRLYERPVSAILATWGVSLIIQQSLELIFGRGAKPIASPVEGVVDLGFVSYPAYRLILIGLACATLGLIMALVRKSQFGLDVRTVIQNRQMAEGVGINTSKTFAIAFAFGAAVAGFAGALIAPFSAVLPQMGVDYLANAFFVVIVGGAGSIGGLIVGSALIGGLTSVLDFQMSPSLAQAIVLLVAIVTVRLRPNGNSWLLAFLAGLAALSGYPAFADGYMLNTLRDALVLGLFAVSLDFFWGTTEILSFGHSAFFGVGGYAMALITLAHSGSAWALVGLAGAAGAAALLAAIVGYFLFFGGVRGSYFTIVTLALAVIAQQLVISWSSVTGGDTGLLGVPPLAIGSLDLSSDLASYWVAAICLAIALVGLWLIKRGRWGLVLTAIADNETRAAALGHNAAARLTLTFILSCAIAGFAGGLYVAMEGVVAPDMIGVLFATEAIVWIAVGGRGTLLGPVVGAILVQRGQQVISSYNPSLWPLIIGCLFVVIVFALPDGFSSLLRPLGARFKRGAA